MKIAFIGGRDIHSLGGIENYVYNLATQLVKMGYEPVVYCESDHNGEEMVNGFRVIHQKSVGGRFLCKILLSYKSTIQSFLHHEHFDVYHYNAWPPSLAGWIPRLFGKTVLMEGHGLEWKRTKYNGWQRRVMRFMEMFTAKMNKHLIMVSQEQTDYFKEHYGKNCITIPTATSLPTPKAKDSEILNTYHIQKNKYFLFLGRLTQEKNPDYMIKAFQKSDLPDMQLVVAGDNNQNPEFLSYLHEMSNVDSRIIFTGAVYGEDKETLLRNCFAFCLPSTLEGLPITLLEAMSYGKVCIASEIQACHEELGESGVWCKYENADDLADKLRYVAQHYEDVKWQCQYNVERVKKYFTWDSVSVKYIQYLKKILKC